MAVDPAGEWLVCGGSFSPTIYHLSTLSKIIAMDVPKEVVTQAAIFAKERVNGVMHEENVVITSAMDGNNFVIRILILIL